MKKIFFACILLAVYYPTTAQLIRPGGVSGISAWHVAQPESDGRYAWKNMLNNQLSTQTNAGTKLNANYSAYFDGNKHTFSIPLKKDNTQAFTVFIVYQQMVGNGEHCVWSVEDGVNTSLVMTTQRLGDLEQYGYINYVTETEPQYRIFTYTHNRPADPEKEAAGELLFNIGKQPTDQAVPAKNFKGYIPEIILYEHAINWNERQRIESYLAIKYGISLSQTYPTSYLNSIGSIIWDAEIESQFNHNITAIGRDNRSGLYQTVSTSSREPGLLQMSVTQKKDLSDDNFLIWADNGGNLLFAEQQGKWKQTGRKWKVNRTGNDQQLRVMQEFDLSYFSNHYLDAGEHYALMIDHSGSGTFPIGKVSFVEGAREKDRLNFPSIEWCKEGGQPEVFSLVTVPQLFARFDIENPSCGQNNGQLKLEINGGVSPYSVQLSNDENTSGIITATTNSRLYTLPDISQGNYTLLIKDTNGMVFFENIRIDSEEMQHISLASHYTLKKGEPLSLTAPQPESGYYKWQLPDGFIDHNAEINIEQVGTYYLILRNAEGCESSKCINITSVDSHFSRLALYPNPAPDGKFTLDIGLYKKDDVFLKIYTIGGVLVRSEKLSGSDYYLYKGVLPQQGSYIISVVCSGSNEEIKLIGM